MSARQIASHVGLGLKRPLLRPTPRPKPQPPVVLPVQDGISIKQASRAYFQKLGAYIRILDVLELQAQRKKQGERNDR